MKLLEHMRNSAFWLIDGLKGRKVKNALNLLNKCENGQWDEKQIEEYQNEQVSKLLNHAKNTVPFYKNQEEMNLKKWPVVNKNILRENAGNILSNKYEKDKLIEMSTSGSTGTPFASLQDINKKKHVNAETLFYNGKIGYLIGKRIIYLRSIVSEVQKSKIQQFTQNIYLLDCNDLSETGIREKLKFIVKYSKKCGAMLMGYASTFTAFQRYFDKYGFDDIKDANIYGIVSGSEMLYDETRKTIEKAFECKCVSRYANEENGFLGQDDDYNNIFYMNRANYYIEILKFDKDIPADENEVGRIVVTDLYNYAMPMIRYDTGDIGAYITKEYKGKERKAIGFFGGRIVDTVKDCEGNIVSPHAVTNLMWKYKNVKQFQFIQKSQGVYEIVLNAIRSEINEYKLIEDYKGIFGNKSVISVKYCDDIPVLLSGKRRYIVNEEKI